ncbi:MAG: outer membrane lipoprotein-sorting protein [Acidobacteria bacterium]|nr:outer membrane lipoprotein-sorting protein [Acidobacteriota bacterium]
MQNVLLILATLPAIAQDARQIVEESQRRSRVQSQRYEGTLQVLDGKGKVSDKRWLYLRIGSAGESKSVLRFTAPAEVKGVGLLIVNHPDRASDQWMWTPALNRERRIALQDRSTRFFGTDFSFEDLEERDVNQFDYKVVGEEMVDGAACWKMESRPKGTRSSQYTHTMAWVSKDHYVFQRMEAYKGVELVRTIRYGDVAQVQGIWTPRLIEVTDVKRKSKTVMKLDRLQFNLPMKEDDFTIQALRRDS